MLSNPFHVYIMFFQGVFGKKNPDNGIYGHAFTGIKNSWSALVRLSIYLPIYPYTYHFTCQLHHLFIHILLEREKSG